MTMLEMRRPDPSFAFGSLRTRTPAAVKLAFLGFTDLQRRTAALQLGAF